MNALELTRQHARMCETTRYQKKGAMAMIDLNRVLNQSPSSMCSVSGQGRPRSEGWNLRGAFVVLLAVVFLVCPLLARAQELNATLSGTVTDSSGAVVPKATVTVTLDVNQRGPGRAVR